MKEQRISPMTAQVAHLYIKMTERDRSKFKRIAEAGNRTMKGQLLEWINSESELSKLRQLAKEEGLSAGGMAEKLIDMYNNGGKSS